MVPGGGTEVGEENLFHTLNETANKTSTNSYKLVSILSFLRPYLPRTTNIHHKIRLGSTHEVQAPSLHKSTHTFLSRPQSKYKKRVIPSSSVKIQLKVA